MTWIRIQAKALVFVILLLLSAVPRAQAQSSTDADSAAIKQTIATLTDASNRHDAHAFVMPFAEDVDFTNVPGTFTHGKKDLEDHVATLFAGTLKSAQRTDSVKRIRFLTPEIASVDADWEMTGMRLPDGSERSQKGLLVVTMKKQKSSWLITVFHEPMLPQTQTPAMQDR